MILKDIVLTGRVVRLEPLGLQHADDLARAGADASIWRYYPGGIFDTLERMREYINSAQAKTSGGAEHPFAIIRLSDGRAVGSTRYFDVRPADRGLEIGHTWLDVEAQRTAINTECKYLLLRHAFEVLGCIRVQLKADARNTQSQRAMERIGCVREGVLRSQIIMPDGHRRDSVMYSIIECEWPGVRARLEGMLARP